MAHYCSKHGVPFFKKGKMKRYAHPIKDADGNDTGEWCNEPEGQTKEQEKPFTYSPEKSASIETQVAVKAVTDLWIADKLPTDCREVALLRSWILSHLNGVNPTAVAVKDAVKEVLEPLGMAIPEGEEKPAAKHVHVELAKPYATQQQLDTLTAYEKKYGKTQELMDKHGFKKKLTKANADILIDEFVLLEDAKN